MNDRRQADAAREQHDKHADVKAMEAQAAPPKKPGAGHEREDEKAQSKDGQGATPVPMVSKPGGGSG